MDTEKVIDKIRKIKAHADSAAKIGNAAEAEAFAEMMQRLLMRHKLEMTDIEFGNLDVDEPVNQFYIDFNKHGLEAKKARIAWAEELAGIVARAHFCRILVHRKSNAITLIGRKSDVAVAEFMIVTLQRLLDSMSIKARLAHNNECKREGRKSDIYGFRESYINAFVKRLAERYEEAKRQQQGESQFALVRVNKADAAVNEYLRQQRERGFIKNAGIVRGFSRAGNAEGIRRGRAAADNVNLNGKAVGSGPTVPPRRLS